jgi:hypothetical protein
MGRTVALSLPLALYGVTASAWAQAGGDPAAATAPEEAPVEAAPEADTPPPADRPRGLFRKRSVDPVVGGEFFAGSYGRAQATFDLTGGRGDPVNVVKHGTRLEQGPYLELDLGWRQRTKEGAKFQVLVTPAFAGDLFHYTGQFNAQLALRNLYAEASDFLPGVPITVWAGSRMYRGDDIYLLDFWPMDNLNTLGGGLSFHPGRTEVAAHVGANRLLGQDFQFQTRKVQAPQDIDGVDVPVLDRQRVVASLRVSQQVPVGDLTFRVKAYGELHSVPAGTQYVDDAFSAGITRALPKDWGSLVGVQASLWGWAPQSFVHLWLRRASGLAAYGELAIPIDGLASDLRAAKAESWMVALTGNHETRHVGVVGAFYAERFSDADGVAADVDDRWDVMAVVRPQVYLAEHVGLGVELSHQHTTPDGLNPWTALRDEPDITKLAILPAVQVAPGNYTRPKVQLAYQVSFLDDAAVAWFAPGDERIDGNVQHFLGLSAEWWINSARVVLPTDTVGPKR